MMKDYEHYKPEIIEVGGDRLYALMMVQLSKCPICEKLMLYIPKLLALPFPAFYKITAKAQAECALCETRKPTSKIQESIGRPSEKLCTDCYKSVPAEQWLKKMEDLEEHHRYDYE